MNKAPRALFHTQQIPQGRLLLSYKPPVNKKEKYETVVKQQYSQQTKVDFKNLSNNDVLGMLEQGQLQHHQLESVLENTFRAVHIRRCYMAKRIFSDIEHNLRDEL